MSVIERNRDRPFEEKNCILRILSLGKSTGWRPIAGGEGRIRGEPKKAVPTPGIVIGKAQPDRGDLTDGR
jgi:hypothetical protein